MSALLGMFVKEPIPGTVKTRLAAGVGPETAAELYAAFVADLVTVHADTADARMLGFAPNSIPATKWAQSLGGSNFKTWPQPEGDLGARMQGFFEHAFASGATRAVLIGSDSPNLPPAYVDQAFECLLENDVVLGPASDGGYYLIGQSGRSRDLFVGTDWSSPIVFEQTLSHVRRIEASLAIVPVWYDIDTAEEARMLRAHLRAADVASPQAAESLKNTRLLLDRVFKSSDIA